VADLALRLPAGGRRALLSSPAISTRGAIGSLLRLAARERAAYAFGTAWILASTAATLLYPQFVRVAIDEALVPGRVDRAALLMAAAAALRALGTFFRGYAFASAALRVVSGLRRRLFGRLLEQQVAFFDRRSTADLGGRLGADAELVHDALGRDLEGAVRDAVCVLAGVSVLLWTSPALTALVVVAGAPVALLFRLAAKRIQRFSRGAQDAFGVAQQVADEALAGIRTVRAFAAEGAEAGRYGAALGQAQGLGRMRLLATAGLDAVAKLLGDVALVGVVWAGARLVGQGELSPGLLVAFILYAELVASCFGDLVTFGAECARVAGAAERVFEVIDAPVAAACFGSTTLPRVAGRVAFEAVGFAYPARPDAPVLRGVDLELAPGEVVALVGPSGAGKSTLARLLLRFYEPTSGAIRLDGVEIGGLEPAWFRQQVGVVEQDPYLFSTSVGENLRYGAPDASDARLAAALGAAHASAFVDGLPGGLAARVGERGVQLSGGQRQRLAIARALLRDPRVLILDEATSALDAESEALVQEALARLQSGRTTLVIAHRLSTVRAVDRVVVLDHGRIVQQGTHAQLLDSVGPYRDLVLPQLVSS